MSINRLPVTLNKCCFKTRWWCNNINYKSRTP